MKHNHHSNLKQYVNDVIALERDIEDAISRQIDDDRVKAHKNLAPLLDQIVRESKERMKELKTISEQEGGKLGAVVKETAMSVTGTLAGLYGKNREHPVSRMVRDDIIALHVLMISYGMLRTLGLSAGHGEVASLSLKGLEQMPPIIVPLTDVLPTIVTLEISKDDPISNPAAAQTVCADMRAAWRLGSPRLIQRSRNVRRPRQFANRQEAGASLVPLLQPYKNSSEAVILALPRGGVPVASEVAKALGLPLDVLIVRKLGVPWNPEAAMGAIASGGVVVINEWVDPHLPQSKEALAEVMPKEKAELERRENLYRSGLPPLPIKNKEVIVIDDGLATGATMRAAVQAVLNRGAKRCVVAVPVGAQDACAKLRETANEVVCSYIPEPFHGVGEFYVDFDQTSDTEVQRLLAHHLGDSHVQTSE